ncbi:MAG: S-layer homology domain-containing protein [Clostridiales Family XIII bacterium]|nr:S-layer homology domain-containing protein [Clostridiales Family XIII bacterium]
MDKIKKIVAALLSVIVVLTPLSGFTWYDGIENVYYESNLEIFDYANFSRVLAGHSLGGVERAYVVTADTQASALKPVVFSGESNARYTVDTMVNTLEAQGYRVVAGVNGDIFSVDTGCPQGLVIHDGKIQSSGYQPKYVITFDENGKGELAYTNLSYGFKSVIYTPQEDGSYQETLFETNVGYFNVPYGAAKALHAYNRNYGAGTGSPAGSVEVVLETGSAEAAQFRVGEQITATVAEVRYSAQNTPIGDTQVVLSAAEDSPYAQSLRMMAAGTQAEIYVADPDQGALSRSRECLGMYYLLYAGGEYFSAGTNQNPRTCIGLKPDGTVMLYVLDGRQPGISGGLGLTDTARHMVNLGCTVVANLDGGGSSTMVVREPGVDEKAVTKNNPSDGKQRAVTNGLFLVYADAAGAGEYRISAYQDNYLAMPGAAVQLYSSLSNGLFEKIGAASGVSYSVVSGDGYVNSAGLFTAGSGPGRSVVEASGWNARTTAEIEVTGDITFTSNYVDLFLDPEQTADINVKPWHGYAPVAGGDNLFTWRCDEKIGIIDENGVFRAANKTGVSGNITVSYGASSLTIPVQVGVKINFTDLPGDHWALQHIDALASEGIVNGMGDNLFKPDDSLTRAQFLAMLAKSVTGVDLAALPSAGFYDVPMDEWYFGYVNWGYAEGIVNGFEERVFAPDGQITREQMTVMLDNFATAMNVTLPADIVSSAFGDEGNISPWASGSVGRIVTSGIMNGQPDGNFEPQGNATRAQAAKVVHLILQHYYYSGN